MSDLINLLESFTGNDKTSYNYRPILYNDVVMATDGHVAIIVMAVTLDKDYLWDIGATLPPEAKGLYEELTVCLDGFEKEGYSAKTIEQYRDENNNLIDLRYFPPLKKMLSAIKFFNDSPWSIYSKKSRPLYFRNENGAVRLVLSESEI